MTLDVPSAARGALRVLDTARDILEERVEDAPPTWSDRRGWTAYLLAMSDADLARCEAEGLSPRAHEMPGTPPSLAALAAAVQEATRLPDLGADTGAPAWAISAEMRAVRARKRPQLVQLAAAAGAMAERARRIVDVGAGSGHFTTLAAELFGREVIGIERRPDRIAAATARAEDRAPHIDAAGGAARFHEADATLSPLRFEPTDLAVGLHACGALGDGLVIAAAEAGCDVALVSCCLQKIEAPARSPLSLACAGLDLRRDLLGLTNLTSQSRGVETTIEATMSSRETRNALLYLLKSRGLDISPGEEMRGINRRRARAGLADIAAHACAHRGLAPPTATEIATFEAEGRRRFAAVRRLSLPRNMLARLVEIAVVLDRAAALTESGHHVLVGTLFDRAVTPRNIALLATRNPSHLPHSPCSTAVPHGIERRTMKIGGSKLP